MNTVHYEYDIDGSMSFLRLRKKRTRIKATHWLKPKRTLRSKKSLFSRSSGVKKKKSPQRLRRGRTGRWSLMTQSIVLTLGLGILGYLVFFQDTFLVKDVTFASVPSDNSLPTDIMSFSRKFTGTNIFLASNVALQSYIDQHHPEIESVYVSKSLPSTIHLSFHYYKPLIHAYLPASDTETDYRFTINAHGSIMQSTSLTPDLPTIELKNISDEDRLRISENTLIFNTEHLQSVIEAIDYFQKTFSIPVVDTHYYYVEREVHLITEKGFSIWIDLTKPVQKQLEKLEKALPMIDIYKDPLEYIDLRITAPHSEKIIFKRSS